MFEIVNNIPALYDSRVITTETDGVKLHVIHNFFSAEECDALIQEGMKYLEPSRVGGANDTTKVDRAVRSSSTAMLSEVSDAAITKLAIERIEQAYGHPHLFSNPLQLNRYLVGEEFKAHHDYHDPLSQAERIRREGQRTWTFLMYLNDGFEGGTTYFPEIGIHLIPRKGTLAFWNNLNADGTPNPLTLHESQPIVSGTKYMMTKWFKNKNL